MRLEVSYSSLVRPSTESTQNMKIAILQCDNVLEKFQPIAGNYPGMIERMFDGVNQPLSFDTYDCQQGQFPKDIHAYDCYITTGSKASVYDGLPWVDELISFVQVLDKHQKKLIGICFGHQVIAIACGGKVSKSAKGWGIGLATNRVLTSPDWMAQPTSELKILVSHQDQIDELPENTVVIAESDFCPYFVVQKGNHFLSVQGHPEWNPQYSRTLLDDRTHLYSPEQLKVAQQSLATEPDNALFVNWIMAFAQ